MNEVGSQPLRSDWPSGLGNSAPPAWPSESPDWRACPALGFHSQKSMKQREPGGGVERAEAKEEMHQSAAPPGSQLSAAPGKQAGARGTWGRGRLAPA